MKKSKYIALIVVLALALIYTFRNFFPGGDGVVKQHISPNGTQIIITQKYMGLFEPYYVEVYFKASGREWCCLYIDHQDTRWRNASIKYNDSNKIISILKDENLRVRWRSDQDTYKLFMANGKSREMPTELKDPTFVY